MYLLYVKVKTYGLLKRQDISKGDDIITGNATKVYSCKDPTSKADRGKLGFRGVAVRGTRCTPTGRVAWL